MASLLLSRRDIDFLLYDWLKVETLTERKRYADHSRETFDATLDLCETLATEHFAPHNKKADANEPRFENGTVVMIPEPAAALKRFGEAGLFAAHADYDIGGMQLPATVHAACFAFFKAANTGTAAYAMLTTAAANLLRKHGTADQIRRFVEPMIAGRFFGTMCLSEPQAGSSLADITMRAEPREDGSYRLFGTKMWISGGDQEISENIVHMVLAKAPGGGPRRARHLALRRAESSRRRRRHARRAQRRRAGRPQPQDGLSRHDEYAPELRRGRASAGRHAGRDRLACRHAAPGPAGDVPHDERGADRRRPRRHRARLHRLPAFAGLCEGTAAGPADRPEGRRAKQVRIIEHPDVRRMLLAQKAYVEGAFAFALYAPASSTKSARRPIRWCERRPSPCSIC